MKVTFISCYLNHHQTDLCLELQKCCDEFYFVATDPMPEYRAQLGYDEDTDSKHDFIVKAYNGENEDVVRQLLTDSDVVIFGSCPDEYIDYRAGLGKLSFIYTERFFKKGTWRRFIPRTRKKVVNRVIRYSDFPVYILCAGAFVAYDLKLCGFDTDKCFRWGYFPQVNHYTHRPKRDNKPVKLLWAGRMLDWKHPCEALYAAKELAKAGVDFVLDIIGTGEEEQKLKELARKLNLSDKVNFTGAMSPDEVKAHMENADVFLMTSDCYEGWGAVVNEAMSTGCCVLASSVAGCVPYLIDDGKSGVIYQYGNRKDMVQKLLLLVKDKKLRDEIGLAAMRTVQDEYSAQTAARRLTEFVNSEDKTKVLYESGPMSKAEVVKNNWYKA
ncbi:MAG: glycosyltransferase family 4 protein [Ruminococcus sp.]|nr:glycosyltransferase family 4 protein [Ruminococcus sp.]